MITHEFDLNKINEAISLFRTGLAGRIIIEINKDNKFMGKHIDIGYFKKIKVRSKVAKERTVINKMYAWELERIL